MKSTFWMCLLAVTLSTTAYANEDEQAAPPNAPSASQARTDPDLSTSLKAEAPSAAPVGLRIVSETLLGGLGSAAGGALGLMMGLGGGGDLASAMLGMGLGVTLGSSLGVMLGGSVVGGGGHFLPSLLGALAGTALTFVLPSPGPELALMMVVALPVAGAIVGYEVSAAMTKPSAHAARPRIVPTIALARQGRGAVAGLAGVF